MPIEDKIAEAFYTACDCGDLQEVKRLLVAGRVDVNSKFRSTPLIAASQKGHLQVVRYLLDNGAYVNGLNLYGETAIYSASRNDHSDVVDLLLLRGARSNHDEG